MWYGGSELQNLVDDVDGLDHHLRAVLVEHLEQFEIRTEPAGAHAHDEAAAAQVIELGDVAGDHCGMVLRYVDDAGAELDRLGLRDQGCHELQRIGDRLRLRGIVLAYPCLREAEFLGEQDRFAIFFQDRGVITIGIVQRHHE